MFAVPQSSLCDVYRAWVIFKKMITAYNTFEMVKMWSGEGAEGFLTHDDPRMTGAWGPKYVCTIAVEFIEAAVGEGCWGGDDLAVKICKGWQYSTAARRKL